MGCIKCLFVKFYMLEFLISNIYKSCIIINTIYPKFNIRILQNEWEIRYSMYIYIKISDPLEYQVLLKRFRSFLSAHKIYDVPQTWLRMHTQQKIILSHYHYNIIQDHFWWLIHFKINSVYLLASNAYDSCFIWVAMVFSCLPFHRISRKKIKE